MKKSVLLSICIILAIIAVCCALRFFVERDENTWLCENGAWVKHGNPADVAPSIGCETQANTMKDTFTYNWSTMDTGPYGDSVTFAISTDLTTWYPSGEILAIHASVPGAVIKDGKIFVYYVNVSEDGKAEQTGFVTSDDNGRTWSDEQLLEIQGIENRAVADPDPVLLEDGRIRLYYFDINESRVNPSNNRVPSPQRIYSAVSSDGVNFTQENGVRFVRDGAFDPDVERDGNTWRMYVGTPDNEVVSAISTDGLNFTEEGVAFSEGAVPDVFLEGGTWHLFTAGINIATSTDGKTFTATGKSFHSPNTQMTADPSVVKLSTGKYLMLYKIR
ncbi:MAG: hypothetical protein WC495_02790 [Patescibacteria group bacterium]|jgi:hypothetical protein